MALEPSRLNAGVAEFVPQEKASPANNEQDDSTKPFPFLNFPREIRNQVYENLLCPYADRDYDQNGHNHWPDIAPLYETAILYTNRQVYTEAREAMLKGNKFVRVFTRGVMVTAILADVPVQVVVHSHHSHEDPVVRKFKGAVISYFLRDEEDIREHGNAPCNTCDILILGRDLDAFVRGVGDPAIGGSRMATAVEHHINFHDPFKKSRDPNYSSLRAQERLLQPFRDHFHGFPNVKIDGKVDKVLAADVLRQVKYEAMPDPDEFIASIQGLKDEGNAFYREDDFMKAIQRWRSASAKMQRLRSSGLWSRVKMQLGPDFVDTLAELFFNVHSNQAQAALAEMRHFDMGEDDMDEERAYHALEVIGHNSHVATTASEAFESAWHPSRRQQAKLCFRSAQAARLVGDFYYAQDFIDRALDLQPDDAAILNEADEIARAMILAMADMGFIQIPGI